MADVAAVGIASLALGRVSKGKAEWMIPKACGSILIGLGVRILGQHSGWF